MTVKDVIQRFPLNLFCLLFGWSSTRSICLGPFLFYSRNRRMSQEQKNSFQKHPAHSWWLLPSFLPDACHTPALAATSKQERALIILCVAALILFKETLSLVESQHSEAKSERMIRTKACIGVLGLTHTHDTHHRCCFQGGIFAFAPSSWTCGRQ